MASERVPDFILVSSEGYGLQEPRRCCVIQRVAIGPRKDCLLVHVEPPIIGQPYGLGPHDIDEVILASRDPRESLTSEHPWPAFVHVARFRGERVPDVAVVNEQDIELIAWAELYQTETGVPTMRRRSR